MTIFGISRQQCSDISDDNDDSEVNNKQFIIPSLEFMSCKINGRRVTMPDPRGKKSLSDINTQTMYQQFTTSHTLPNSSHLICISLHQLLSDIK